jgi:hypothetical protein
MEGRSRVIELNYRKGLCLTPKKCFNGQVDCLRSSRDKREKNNDLIRAPQELPTLESQSKITIALEQ